MRLQFPALVLLVLITGLVEEREDAVVLVVGVSDAVNAVLMLAAVATVVAVAANTDARIIKLFYI
jgi:hypothetical protein